MVYTPDVAAEWLLTAHERGNPATEIDAARQDGRAWKNGNLVGVHVDGAAYFARLHQLLSGLGPGDWVSACPHQAPGHSRPAPPCRYPAPRPAR